jgi:hypothetical protein
VLPKRETCLDWKLFFAEDVVFYSDGGGLARAARVPVSGRKRVATFITAVSPHFWKGVTLASVETNGQAAVLMSRHGVPVALAAIDASAQGINQIMWIVRPLANSLRFQGHAKDWATASHTLSRAKSYANLATRPADIELLLKRQKRDSMPS